MGATTSIDPGRRARRSAHLLLLLCVVIWGWTFVASKVALEFLQPVELVGVRFGIGVPLLAVLVLLRRTSMRFRAGQLVTVGCGAAIITAHFLLQAAAMRWTSASNTAWIIAVSPLAIALLAFWILREHPGSRLWVGLAVATTGVIVLVSRGSLAGLGGPENIGDWLVLVTAGTWAVYTIVTRDLSRARDPLAVALAVYAPLAVVCAGIMATGSRWATFAALPARAVVALLFLGVLGTLSQWFWQIGIARLGAARAGVYLYLEPLSTMVLAVPLLGEPVGWFTIVGGGAILAGVAWGESGRRRPA